MKFLSNVVQTEAPQFVDLGLLTINTSNDLSLLVTPATRIRRPTDGYHWSMTDRVFGEATSVIMNVARSGQDYSYKTNFEIWRENQESERLNILMSRPTLDSTYIVTYTANITMAQLELTPIQTKTPYPTQLT